MLYAEEGKALFWMWLIKVYMTNLYKSGGDSQGLYD